MARSGAHWPRRREVLQSPRFCLRHEIEIPGVPLLCMLLPLDDLDPAVEVVVNRSYGLLGYKHAAYHVDHPPVGPRVCWIGLDCGYVEASDGDNGAGWDDGLDWGDGLDVGVDGVT